MSKDSPPVADPRIALLGNMDEASASLGLARSEGGMEKSKNSAWNYSGFPTALWATWRCPRSRTRSGSNRSVSNKKRVDEVLENWKARTQIPKEFVVPGESKTWGAIRLRAFGGTQGGAQHGSREPSPGSSAHSKSPTASRTYCSS